jgi:hypothetical protein
MIATSKQSVITSIFMCATPMKGTLAAGVNAASCCVAKCILVILVACNLSIVRAGTLTGASVSLSNTIAGRGVDFTVRFTTATTISDFKAISVTGVNFVMPSGNVDEQIDNRLQ